MFFLFVLVALGLGYASTVALVLGSTFAMGMLVPSLVAKSDRLRALFLAANLLVWTISAAIGASIAALICPLTAAQTDAGFAAILLAVVVASAVQRRKQQSLPYQLAVVAACLVGIFASMKGLPLLR